MGRSRQRQRQRERRRQQQSQSGARAPAQEGRPPSPPWRPPARRSGPGKGPIYGGAAVLLVAVAIVIIVFAVKGTGGGGATPTATPAATPTATPMLGTPSTAVGKPIDGIHCGAEQLAYHIHQHITLYLNGKHVNLPAYVGFSISGSGKQATVNCLYWIHVHYESPNFIHVESPTKRIYTLGQMIDIWKATTATTYPPHSTFLTTLLKSKPSQITAFSNLKRWTENYRSIPLTEHLTITLEIGKPVIPPKLWTNWAPVG